MEYLSFETIVVFNKIEDILIEIFPPKYMIAQCDKECIHNFNQTLFFRFKWRNRNRHEKNCRNSDLNKGIA